jgi:glycosyltransferase involved in cell wall biosynthesis
LRRHVLLANLTLAGRTGTEVVTRDLALGLARRGHSVSVYSPVLGPIADELGGHGIRVCARLADVRGTPDIVHGHHHVQMVEALLHFPTARGVFVCHDRTAPHSIPPRIDSIALYVAVDRNCLERLTADWNVPESRTRLILNAVDLTRFAPRAPLPQAPGRALIFSHTAGPGSHDAAVSEACAALGIPVDVIGARAGIVTAEPEHLLPRYDLVFAKGRCAIEAMAVGCAVVLCDAAGMGPMVTMADYEALRAWNFGARTLRDPLDVTALVSQIRRYDAAAAADLSRAIRRDADLETALNRYVALYEEALAEPAPPRTTGPMPAIIDPLIQRIAALELELAALKRSERMDPLREEDIAALRMTVEDVPTSLRAGETAVARVRLRNGLADRPLGSWRPHPLQWGVRWRPIGRSEFYAKEHPRTPIRYGLAPLAEEEFAVRVIAPAAPGSYILRITLVQEYLQWLDQAETPIYHDVAVRVIEDV